MTAQEIVNEGVACIKAGAAVIHAHTLDPDTGKQNNDLENCVAFIGGICSLKGKEAGISAAFPAWANPVTKACTMQSFCCTTNLLIDGLMLGTERICVAIRKETTYGCCRRRDNVLRFR